MNVLDLDKQNTEHKPHYLFSDDENVYLVHSEVYDDFLKQSSKLKRTALAVLVIKHDSDIIVKSRYW